MTEGTPAPSDWLANLDATSLQAKFDQVDREIPVEDHGRLMEEAEALRGDLETGNNLAAVGARVLKMTEILAGIVA